MTTGTWLAFLSASPALQAASLMPESGWLAWRPGDAALQAALMEAAVLLVASAVQRARVLQARRKQVGVAASTSWAAEPAPILHHGTLSSRRLLEACPAALHTHLLQSIHPCSTGMHTQLL